MLLRLSDYYCVRDKLLDGVLASKLSSLLSGVSNLKRVQTHWDSKAVAGPGQRVRAFSEIPQVRKRIAKQYDGKDVITWIFDTYLRGKTGMRALSVGCGTGGPELQLAELARGLGTFSNITGFDLSPSSIELANAGARSRGLDDVLTFTVGTIEQPPAGLPWGSFDAVFAFSSLHHLKHLREHIVTIRRWLKTGGLLVAHEYIGPRRQQYSREEVALINSLFRSLPEKHRRDWHTGSVRSGVPIPSALLMWLYDPSETVEADDIAPSIRECFSNVELHVELGTLLVCLLKEIGHNFPADDPDATKTINALCDIELSLIESGLLAPHYATIIARA